MGVLMLGVLMLGDVPVAVPYVQVIMTLKILKG